MELMLIILDLSLTFIGVMAFLIYKEVKFLGQFVFVEWLKYTGQYDDVCENCKHDV